MVPAVIKYLRPDWFGKIGVFRGRPLGLRGGVGGAKGTGQGNTGEQHTCRTPSRESVSQGLERVREAAKQRKKERFTALWTGCKSCR
jgi:hypothetical protein